MPARTRRRARLQGVFCADAEEGLAAARAGADFLVMSNALADGELAALCGAVAVPVYARSIALEQAWGWARADSTILQIRVEEPLDRGVGVAPVMLADQSVFRPRVHHDVEGLAEILQLAK